MAQSAVWLAGMGRWTHVATSIFSKSVVLEAGLPACTFYRGISFYINMQQMEWPQYQQECTTKPQLNRLCLQMLIYAKYSWERHFQLHWKHYLALTWVCGPGAPTRQMCAWSWHFKKDSPMREKNQGQVYKHIGFTNNPQSKSIKTLRGIWSWLWKSQMAQEWWI